MRKLIIFGDSFSCEYNRMCKQYVEWKGYEPKNFFQIISDKLEIPYLNFAECGIDNYSIFHNVIKNIDKVKNDDIIILGWTILERFRIISKKEWISIGGHTDFNKCSADIPVDKLLDFIINRNINLDFYKDELKDFITVINKIFNCNIIIHWSWMGYQNVNLTLPHIGYSNINEETNGKVKDFHLNEKSAKIYSDYFLDYINNTKRIF